MPIRDLPRRMTELGRIRLGQRTTYANGKTGPAKLDRFRFTTGHLRLAEAIAAQYGGHAQAWEGTGRAEFEVYTEARSVPVVVVPGGCSQWMEAWTAGGCVRRCDSVTEHRSADEPIPCVCKATGDQVCKPVTRLSVMLPQVETLGTWRLETRGWNAAAELPAMADIAARFGEYVPARLELVERVAVSDGQTARYVVPVLELEVSAARLAALTSGQATPALADTPDPTTPALASADQLDQAPTGWLQLLADATTPGECRAIWQQARDAGQLDGPLREAITARADALAEQPPTDPWEGGPDPRPPVASAGERDASPRTSEPSRSAGAAVQHDASRAAEDDGSPTLVAQGPDTTPPASTPPEPEPTTRGQMRALHVAYKSAGVSIRADRLAHASGELGHDVHSFSTLTRAEGHHLLRALDHHPRDDREIP